MTTIPSIRNNKYDVPTLYVDDKPFLMRAGELHNSSASSLDYMEQEVWPNLRALHLNTLLLSLAWEDLEPEEGHYDDHLLAGLVAQARRENVRLILLWFGLWKNGESFYVPGWVKSDSERFFRARHLCGAASNTISPLCSAAVEKDKAAFCHIMAWLKEHDEQHTVIMIQVENEIGFLGSDRDHSPQAEAAFCAAVPEEIQKAFAVEGDWQAAFGERAGEAFMAYHYAKAVENIASAGRAIDPLPCYVNAWIEQHPNRPGVYPSGGPVAGMFPMWKLAAPSICLLAPDIYLPDFKAVCESYQAGGNPLFIPETGRCATAASSALFAFGGLNALGFSPFGIEDVIRNKPAVMESGQLAQLNISADAFYDKETAPYLIQSYQLLEQMQDVILQYRGSGQMIGFIRRNQDERGCIVPMDEYDIQLDYIACNTTARPGSAGFIIREPSGFYIVGCNVRFGILPKLGSRSSIGLIRYEEGAFQNGTWQRRRILNGDELYDTTLHDMPECRHIKVYRHH